MAINNTIAILAVLLVFAGLGTQFASYMNVDNAWLLHVASEVVGGKHLHVDIIETNPPLIVYIMMIPVYLANLVGISHVYGFILFIGALSIGSLALSFKYISEPYLKLALVFGLVFLPAINFGEREHIFMILLLPYFCSFMGDKKPSVLVCLLAGVGLCLKPFFLLVWAGLVLTKMVVDKKPLAFLETSNFIIGAVVIAYPLYLIFIEKTYIEKILPLLFEYYGSYNSPAKQLLKNSFSAIVLGQMAFWILFIKDRKSLSRAAYFSNFANLAAVMVVLVQGKIWSNYFYPPHFFSLLTNTIITFSLLQGDVKPLWNKVAAIISSFMMVVFFTIAMSVNLKNGFGLKEEGEDKLTGILREKAAGKNVVSLGFDLGGAFPSVMASNAHYALRHGCLWMLPGMYKGEQTKDMVLAYRSPEQKGEDEAKLAREVIEDFKNSRPEIVVVINSAYHSPGIGDYKFDFIEYFSKEPEFAQIWKNYSKIDEIREEKSNYVKEIYQLQE